MMRKLLILFALLLVACSGKPESPEPEPTPGNDPELRYTVTGYKQVAGHTSDGHSLVFNVYDRPDALYTADRKFKLVYLSYSGQYKMHVAVSGYSNHEFPDVTFWGGDVNATVQSHRDEPITIPGKNGSGTTITLTVVK